MAPARAGRSHLSKLPCRVTEHGGDRPGIPIDVKERRSHNSVLTPRRWSRFLRYGLAQGLTADDGNAHRQFVQTLGSEAIWRDSPRRCEQR